MIGHSPDETAPAPHRVPLRAALVAAVIDAKRDHAWDSEQLEELVRAYAAAARRAGEAPEQFITGLKQLLRAEALADVGDWFRSVVVNRLVVWGIDGYYELDGDAEG